MTIDSWRPGRDKDGRRLPPEKKRRNFSVREGDQDDDDDDPMPSLTLREGDHDDYNDGRDDNDSGDRKEGTGAAFHHHVELLGREVDLH